MKYRQLSGQLLHFLQLTILICTSAVAFAQSDDPVALQRQASELFQAGRHIEAVGVAQRYVAAARARYGEQHVEYARALSRLGHTYDALGRYAEAEPLYARTVTILEKRRGP